MRFFAPTIVVFSGTSLTTVVPAPTVELFPIMVFGIIVAPAPINAPEHTSMLPQRTLPGEINT